ncbi:MAG: SGNH/GDSL hydrolase family protein, partial [Oscillospiraceae bacterium]|nr:SGNH/GDSL hydrolase family protein [Oscillospiraceae bacterium]
MNTLKKINFFGDSILKGVQIHPDTGRYHVDCHIDTTAISAVFGGEIENFSSFGCTVVRGRRQIEKFLANDGKCDAIIMNYGGNDCDYHWNEIAANPDSDHSPHVPLDQFERLYYELIDFVKREGIIPILCTLTPLEPQRFHDWFCRDLDKGVIVKWLDGINSIYRHQENYSRRVEKIARVAKVPLVDLRGAMLGYPRAGQLLCEDGTHVNTQGQQVLTRTFADFFNTQNGGTANV